MMIQRSLVRSMALPLLLLSFVVMGTALGRKANRMEPSVRIYRDGVFQAKAPGFVDDITVCVKIHKGKIASVRVVKHEENYPRDAVQVIPQRIVKAQGVDGVEAVTSATITSNGIIEAVKKALAEAQMPACKADTIPKPNPRLHPN